MYKSITILLALIIGSNIATGKETLSTSYYDGNAPISIDGNLDDWDFLELPVTDVTITNDWTMMPAPDSEADLSADFRCFIDNSFLYVGVEVTDDVLVFGQESFMYSWNDDAVDLKLDGDLQNIEKGYFDANDFQVRVSLDQDGSTTLEGMVPFVEGLQIPTIWEKAGVRAILQPGGDGYTAEIAIPLYLLGYTSGSEIGSVGLNVQVYDDDNTGDFDHQLSWSDDPDNTSWKSTETYNVVQFSKASGAVQASASEHQAGDVTIVLDEPINSFSYGNIISALEKMRTGKFSEAEVFIDDINADNSMIKGILYKEIENGDKAFTYLNRVSDDPDTRIGRYVLTNKYGLGDDKVALYQEYLDTNREMSNYELFQIRDYIILEKIKAGDKTGAAHLILEILNEKTYDPVTVDGWCRDLLGLGQAQQAYDYLTSYTSKLQNEVNNENYYLLTKRLAMILWKMGRYEEANDNLSMFINHPAYGNEAKLLIAQNMFCMQDYKESRRLAENIKVNSTDSKTILDADLLIFSIERMERMQ